MTNYLASISTWVGTIIAVLVGSAIYDHSTFVLPPIPHINVEVDAQLDLYVPVLADRVAEAISQLVYDFTYDSTFFMTEYLDSIAIGIGFLMIEATVVYFVSKSARRLAVKKAGYEFCNTTIKSIVFAHSVALSGFQLFSMVTALDVVFDYISVAVDHVLPRFYHLYHQFANSAAVTYAHDKTGKCFRWAQEKRGPVTLVLTCIWTRIAAYNVVVVLPDSTRFKETLSAAYLCFTRCVQSFGTACRTCKQNVVACGLGSMVMLTDHLSDVADWLRTTAAPVQVKAQGCAAVQAKVQDCPEVQTMEAPSRSVTGKTKKCVEKDGFVVVHGAR
ncbi:hypothetical protein BAUCODRAFT_332772 [Baudoinia panamericana UAMH 10762]|uniref:Uncharacterized protein n=1 Tax=Baudoinia panamericana (strain UAMH 10762) TaxID=717646 RepID=M2MXK2_BAUPA|nr:uncharacterized protein BAUCODRAFT_332772 [Baudoinia panamericana UAMH 10762]EMC90980.1 hypothetical protein BAUCODRAFT_332772 [Baudoinia panamericana UAMH 10762]